MKPEPVSPMGFSEELFIDPKEEVEAVENEFRNNPHEGFHFGMKLRG